MHKKILCKGMEEITCQKEGARLNNNKDANNVAPTQVFYIMIDPQGALFAIVRH